MERSPGFRKSGLLGWSCACLSHFCSCSADILKDVWNKHLLKRHRSQRQPISLSPLATFTTVPNVVCKYILLLKELPRVELLFPSGCNKANLTLCCFYLDFHGKIILALDKGCSPQDFSSVLPLPFPRQKGADCAQSEDSQGVGQFDQQVQV